MPLMECPTCGRQVSTNAASCPGCGEPLAPTGEGGKSEGSPPSRPEPSKNILTREFNVGTSKKGKVAAVAFVVLAAVFVSYRLGPVLVEKWTRPSPPKETAVDRSPKSKPSGPVTTKSGYIACRSSDLLKDVFAFLRTEDRSSLNAYLQSGRCIALKDGVEVTVTDWGFATTEFVYQGTKYYTPTEALNQ